jgi:hypothetical protein
MQHFEVRDLEAVGEAGPLEVLEPYDLFVYGHTGAYEDAYNRLLKDGKHSYRYFNCLTLPLEEWIGGGNPWFDWIDSVAVRRWHAVLTDTLGREARFIAFGKPRLFDWTVISSARADTLIRKQMELSGSLTRNLFLDQLWLVPAEWMFDPASGVTLGGCLTPAEMATWETNVGSYVKLARMQVQTRNGIVLFNGGTGAPTPTFFENSQWSWYWGPWESVVNRWRSDPRNVLSIDPGIDETRLLDTWIKYGGIISVTGDNREQVKPFYERAARCRKAGKVVP